VNELAKYIPYCFNVYVHKATLINFWHCCWNTPKHDDSFFWL